VRVSARKGDPEYRIDAYRWRVKLDGDRLRLDVTPRAAVRVERRGHVELIPPEKPIPPLTDVDA